MLTYATDLTQIFVAGFSEPYVCHFVDGYYNGPTDIGSSFIDMSTFSEVSNQPTGDYWIKLMISDGFVFNDSITNGETKYKRLITFVDFAVYWPNDKSMKELREVIEPKLDSLFLNIDIRGTDDSEIYSSQDSPKDIVRFIRAEGDNKWNQKVIRYPFEVRYI